MELQTNPYLAWQLTPGLILLGIGLYIQSRPIKKRESNAFSFMMFGGAWWAFANAIQAMFPNPSWQWIWYNLMYLGIMIIPTSWFLLAVKLTGVFREYVEKYENRFWIAPIVTYLLLLTSAFHQSFIASYDIGSVNGFVFLTVKFGVLFYIHTAYSYLLMISGMLVLGYSLIVSFKNYGIQAYGLILGVVAPLAGNIYFLFGSPPPGSPDPTPIIFTVTGIAFAWAIFGGHILEVVPLAHESIVRQLSTGVIILDAEKNIRDVNDAARRMLGLTSRVYAGGSLSDLVERNPEVVEIVNQALDESILDERDIQVTYPATGRTYDAHISHFGDGLDKTAGWLIQFNDVSSIKQTEENLVATQNTMRSILDTLPDSYFEADRNGVIIYANKSFLSRVGYEKIEDVRGKNFRNFTHKQSVREIYDKFKTIYETGETPPAFLYKFRTKEGKIYIGETTVSPIVSGGHIVGTRGLIRDVTNRVNADEEIRNQKDLLDSLLKQSPIAMVINDKLNQITMVNPAFEKLFGFTRDEVLGKRLEDFLPSLEAPQTGRVNTSNTSVVKSTAYVRKRKTKDGRILDVEIFNTPFHVGGERFGYLVFYNDITDRLKTQNELEKTQTSYFEVIETLQDAYFEVLLSGYFVYVNKALCTWTGYTRDELLGRHFRVVSSRKSFRDTVKRYEMMYEDGNPIPSFEFIYKRKDGQEYASEMVVSPIVEDGAVVGARGIIRDISLRVQAEEVLREAKEAAESRAGELSAINRLAETVVKSLDLRDILQSVCEELTNIFEIRNAGIGLVTEDKKRLEIVAFHAIDEAEQSVLGTIIPIEGNTSSIEVIEKKKTLVIQDAQNDPRTSSISDLSKNRGTRSIMIVPLLARGEAIGTIGMPAKDPFHVFRENEIELAETIASQIAAAVDNAQLYARTESALGVAERDLEIGRQIQSGFFPEKLPNLPGWEVAVHFHAARQVAGDFYDVFQLKDSNLTAFIIADVCDKGVGAALFMVLFRSLLRAFSGMDVASHKVDEQLLKIIQNTNDFIAEYHGKSNMFATLFFGVLDPDSGKFSYINGGHEPPVIMDKNGKVIKRLMPTGPAVGMFTGMEFKVESMTMNHGDMLVGFTDGTTDAKNMSGQQFTEDRLIQNISTPWTSVFSMLFDLNSNLQKHIGGVNQFDDITLIAFRRAVEGKDPTHGICRKAELENLGELREFIESAGQYCGLTHDEIFPFKLAVDELCANIIQYGFEDREPGMLSLFFGANEKDARMIIRDNGKHFSPDQAQSPDVEAGWEERQVGGLGIYFVKELMDNVTYNKTKDDANQYVLEKSLNTSKMVKE